MKTTHVSLLLSTTTFPNIIVQWIGVLCMATQMSCITSTIWLANNCMYNTQWPAVQHIMTGSILTLSKTINRWIMYMKTISWQFLTKWMQLFWKVVKCVLYVTTCRLNFVFQNETMFCILDHWSTTIILFKISLNFNICLALQTSVKCIYHVQGKDLFVPSKIFSGISSPLFWNWYHHERSSQPNVKSKLWFTM